jgi:hypothetical protein
MRPKPRRMSRMTSKSDGPARNLGADGVCGSRRFHFNRTGSGWRLSMRALTWNPLERARTERKLAPGFLIRSAPEPRRVVDRVGARSPKRLFFPDARWRRCSCSTRERRQPQVLRRGVSVDDVVGSRRALQRGSGRPSRILDMHEAVDALALTDNRNLLCRT